MRTWAQWCINNNLRWLVYVVSFLFVPVTIIVYILFTMVPDILKEISHEFRRIGAAKKTIE